jgi:hypothetical protein
MRDIVRGDRELETERERYIEIVRDRDRERYKEIDRDRDREIHTHRD